MLTTPSCSPIKVCLLFLFYACQLICFPVVGRYLVTNNEIYGEEHTPPKQPARFDPNHISPVKVIEPNAIQMKVSIFMFRSVGLDNAHIAHNRKCRKASQKLRR